VNCGVLAEGNWSVCGNCPGSVVVVVGTEVVGGDDVVALLGGRAAVLDARASWFAAWGGRSAK
jgi:hypothetical protein